MSDEHNGSEGSSPSPSRFVERDVVDLKIDAGKFEVRLDNLERNTVTKEEFANKRADGLRLALTLIIPLLAAAIGALAITFTGILTN